MAKRERKPSEHTKKDVRKALEALVVQGWKIYEDGHWGTHYCPCEARCTTIPVGGTPGNPTREAKRIRHAAGRCPKPEDSPQRSLAGRDHS